MIHEDDAATLFEGIKLSPGLAGSVVGPHGVVHAFSTGDADIARGVAASTKMVCPWFSMTKIVIATAAMRLVDRGELDLDAPIAPLIPQFERLRPEKFVSSISARHLLSHSAGLANPIPIRWIHPADAPPLDQSLLTDRLLSKHRKLRFAPGTRSSYSNLSTLSLGVALSTIAGTPLTEVVQREVLTPVRMGDSGFSYSDAMLAAATVGYHPRRSPMRFLLPRWVIGESAGQWTALKPFLLDGHAYGGLVGSLADAARFLQMHVADGELDGARILSADTVRLMQQIRWRGRRVDLGLGWFRPTKQAEGQPAFVEHLGGGAGFHNVIRLYPTLGLGVAVMGNATKYDVDAVVARAIAKVV